MYHLAPLLALTATLSVSLSHADSAEPKLQVFILAGQSNMVGAGRVSAHEDPQRNRGTLERLAKDAATRERFRHTIDASGEWIERDDVHIWTESRCGKLSVGYGARRDAIGPEFQFGHAVGAHFDEPVLLIKCAWGGKSLAVDFLPPGAAAARGRKVGPFYEKLLEQVREVLGDLEKHVPGYAGGGYELAGFAWHQGWNDGLNKAHVAEYEENLTHFIRDLRRDLKADGLPFVIATSGFGGWAQANDRRLGIIEAQLAVARRPEFAGKVQTVETRGFFRPAEQSPSRQGYHWNSNAETYFLIGDAMAETMLDLTDPTRDEPTRRSLARSLSLHASFDAGFDADFARGDARLHTAPKGKFQEDRPGLHTDAVGRFESGSLSGSSLRFTKKSPDWLFYRAGKNVAYRRENWNATLSFWLRLDPDEDLEPGWVDPLQLTDKKWDDAAIWVDFTKDEKPRHFRLGTLADKGRWNPEGTEWDKIPEVEKPTLRLERLPFSGEKWTHVLIRLEGFNQPGEPGRAELWLDGASRGAVVDREQVFTHDPTRAALIFGIAYSGDFDELAVFDRALDEREIRWIYRHPGLAGLR